MSQPNPSTASTDGLIFTDHFSEGSQLYASSRPRYPRNLFSLIAELAPARACAWDCGTGNGQAAVSLAEFFEHVQASDPSAEQIANAIPTDNVSYSVQTAESTVFPAGCFDAICVAQALHWFKLDTFFAEVRRVAKTGAVFCAWGYDWFQLDPDFDGAFQDSVLAVIEPFWSPANQLLWSGYEDVKLPFAKLKMPSLLMECGWTFHQLMGYVRTWSATRACVDLRGADFWKQAEQQLSSLWGQPLDARRTVTMNLHTLAGRVV